MTGADLVVVGAGVAGLCAARRAQQLGATVSVLERSDDGPGFGNGRLSGGWFHAAKRIPTTPPEDLYREITARTDGAARPDVARAWADNVGRAFRFLQDEGATFAPLGPDVDEEMQNALMPQRPAVLGQQWRGTGPDLLLSAMWRSYIAGGGDYRPSHRARELLVEAGRVVGVRAETPHGPLTLEGRAVLLADGGFQANPDLVARHITGCYKLRGSPNDTGDGLLMGLAAGGVAVNMGWFYGWPLCRDALHDDRLWPYPGPLALLGAGVLVDGSGRRFVDEGLPGERLADAIARSATPGNCWVVVDEVIWSGVGAEGDVPINPTLADAGGTVVTAGSIAGIAEAAGLPAGALRDSVEQHNRFVGDGRQPEPSRSGVPIPVLRPPFRAVPVVAGITFTMGGLAVDGHARVLDGDGRPIPGLYAAGGTMGGLQGGPRSGYAGGWSEASTFGLLAAEHACRQQHAGAGRSQPFDQT